MPSPLLMTLTALQRSICQAQLQQPARELGPLVEAGSSCGGRVSGALSPPALSPLFMST